jgi:hypothetical protein
MIPDKKILVGFVCLQIAFAGFAQEFRGIIEYKDDLIPKIDYGIKLQFRNDLNNNSLLDKTSLGANLEYELLKRLSVSGGFKYTFGVYNDNSEFDNEFFNKYRITTDIEYKTKKKAHDLRFSNQFRFQYNNTEHDKEKMLVRNKFKCNYLFTKKTTIYFALEPYYSLKKKAFTNFRVYEGNKFKVYGKTIDVFFIFQLNCKDSKFFSNQIIGFSYQL